MPKYMWIIRSCWNLITKHNLNVEIIEITSTEPIVVNEQFNYSNDELFVTSLEQLSSLTTIAGNYNIATNQKDISENNIIDISTTSDIPLEEYRVLRNRIATYKIPNKPFKIFSTQPS